MYACTKHTRIEYNYNGQTSDKNLSKTAPWPPTHLLEVTHRTIKYACGWFGHKHKQSHITNKATSDPAEKNSFHNEGSQLSQTPEPESIRWVKSTLEHEDLVELKENLAYGPIAT